MTSKNSWISLQAKIYNFMYPINPETNKRDANAIGWMKFISKDYKFERISSSIKYYKNEMKL